MADPATIAKKLKDYLNTVAPPNDGKTHHWVIGEDHLATDHLTWLRANLDDLQKHHNFQTIGLERPASFNVFLWAYQDGTLARELGSTEKAKEYLRAIAVAGAKPQFKDTVIAHMDLAMDAMDRGMRVVAYDSRNTLALDEKKFAEWIAYFDTEILPKTPEDANAFLSSIRSDTQKLAKLSTSFESKLGWMSHETTWLLKKYPQYATRLQSIEALVEAGHKKIAEGKLTSDALSATVFDAMAKEGNRLPIIGAEHIDGFGATHAHEMNPLHPAHIHGTFGHHLFALGQAQREHQVHTSTVACTVLATTARANTMNEAIQFRFDSQMQLKAVKGTKFDFLDLHTGNLAPMWQPPQSDWRTVELGQNFPMPDQVKDFKKLEAEHINPLLMDEIKTPAAKIRAIMNDIPSAKR